MFKKLAAEALGISDVGVIIAPADYDKVDADDYLFHGGVVYDLVYKPPHTKCLDTAARAGCRTIGGLDMLVAQAQAVAGGV